LYGRENLGGVWGFLSQKTLANLKKFQKGGSGVVDPQNPTLNTPLTRS